MQWISCGSYISRNSAQCPMTNELVSDKDVRIVEMSGRSFEIAVTVPDCTPLSKTRQLQ